MGRIVGTDRVVENNKKYPGKSDTKNWLTEVGTVSFAEKVI